MKIGITGATGFIGQALMDALLKHTEASLQLAVRKHKISKGTDLSMNSRIQVTPIDTISSATQWKSFLVDCSIVIHAAARVHIMDKQKDDAKLYHEINVEGTLHLARQAIKARVKRFIYLSTIKVNGELTPSGIPFKPEDEAKPEDAYARSKFEAEQGLLRLARDNPMEVVIIRLPMVYGENVKGNFLRLMQLLKKGIPLPLGAMNNNKRSLLSTGNLTNFIILCLKHPLAANQIFLISDNEDLSTTALLKKMRLLFRKKALLLPVPFWVLQIGAALLGKKPDLLRLSSSLQVDISKAQQLLHWEPVLQVDEALSKTVQAYLSF